MTALVAIAAFLAGFAVATIGATEAIRTTEANARELHQLDDERVLALETRVADVEQAADFALTQRDAAATAAAHALQGRPDDAIAILGEYGNGWRGAR